MSSPGESSAAQPLGSRCAKCGCIAVLCVFAALVIGSYLELHLRLRRFKHADAKSISLAIENAIEQFRGDYDRYPVPSPASNDTNLLTDKDSGIIAVLKGMDDIVNPKKKDYLGDIKDAKLLKGKPVNGLWIESEHAAGLYDPWGQPYYIRLDTDGDGLVEDPSSPANKVKTFSLIWSAGNDMGRQRRFARICAVEHPLITENHPRDFGAQGQDCVAGRLKVTLNVPSLPPVRRMSSQSWRHLRSVQE